MRVSSISTLWDVRFVERIVDGVCRLVVDDELAVHLGHHQSVMACRRSADVESLSRIVRCHAVSLGGIWPVSPWRRIARIELSNLSVHEVFLTAV